jgi:nucleotide-binding universal stress UspA family protein
MAIHALDLAPISGGDYGEHRHPHVPVVVVGYDGSPASRLAIDYAVERVGPEGRVVVVDAARECSAAEVVVGAHGSDRDKSGLGSVPLALLRGCDRPLVVVPRGKPRP